MNNAQPSRASDKSQDEVVLSATNLSRSFGGIRAVANMSFELKKGSITGLIGPNGAGKSTLFNLVTGVDRSQSGQVFLGGEDVTKLPSYKLARRGLIRTFQLSREFSGLTVLENLMLSPQNQRGEHLLPIFFNPAAVKSDDKAVFELACEVLEISRLKDLKDEYAANLSGGQKKLLELARTLMIDCHVILLDEPGAGVNPALMKTLTDMIVDLNRNHNKTFFIVEHDMDLVADLCDPVIVMTEGQKLIEGTFNQVRADERVIEAYLGGGARDD